MNYIQVYPTQISQSVNVGPDTSYILILTAADPQKNECQPGPREVPILIGENEAQAIIMAVEGRRAKRPLTHNLIASIMEEYMLSLKRVTIDRFEEGIFYSTLHISDGFSEKAIDSRTSDAIVLALLQDAEILMNPSVFEETCMEPGALTANLPDAKADGQQNELESLGIEALEALLRECEENEDYERAQEIMNQINALKGNG